MDMVTSNQLEKITNAQFEELQIQIAQVILENKIQEIFQEEELTDIVISQSEVDIVKCGIPEFLSGITGFQELQDSHKELQDFRIPGFLLKELQDFRKPRISVVKN
ncbi:hypothetical protein G9A89_016151 [Geosiphon pyriformis]|nr:hypothetical protein G9A89_016151 [Geosiphon pyriformis]